MAKKALLIGINDYEQIGDLRGCLNDVTNVRHLLMRFFDFRAEDISLLVDRSAVKSRIEKRIKWLFKDAGKDDHLVLHFSGHGSYVRDLNDDEDDRQLGNNVDELICLYDMNWRKRSSYMIDDEIGKHFDKLPEGAKLTVILDCCHSGTLTRDVVAPPPDLAPPPDVAPRGFIWIGASGSRDVAIAPPPDASPRGFIWIGASGTRDIARGQPSGGPVLGPDELASRPRFVAPPLDIELRCDECRLPPRMRFARPRNGVSLNHILLAGCRDDQTSADARIGGAFNGAFSYYLCKTVREANGRISYRNLIGQVQRSLRFNGFSQVPQLEGPGQDQDQDFLF